MRAAWEVYRRVLSLDHLFLNFLSAILRVNSHDMNCVVWQRYTEVKSKKMDVTCLGATRFPRTLYRLARRPCQSIFSSDLGSEPIRRHFHDEIAFHSLDLQDHITFPSCSSKRTCQLVLLCLW